MNINKPTPPVKPTKPSIDKPQTKYYSLSTEGLKNAKEVLDYLLKAQQDGADLEKYNDLYYYEDDSSGYSTFYKPARLELDYSEEVPYTEETFKVALFEYDLKMKEYESKMVTYRNDLTRFRDVLLGEARSADEEISQGEKAND